MDLDPALQSIYDTVLFRMSDYAQLAREEIVASLSTPGSVVPFVVSAPGQPSFNWDDELTAGIFAEEEADAETIAVTLISAGRSFWNQGGTVIAADAEFGSWWDGWAFDSTDWKWVKAAEPHFVEPRPHMAPALERAQAKIIRFVCRKS